MAYDPLSSFTFFEYLFDRSVDIVRIARFWTLESPFRLPARGGTRQRSGLARL